MGVPPGDSFGGAPALKPHPFLSEKKITCRKQHSTCINLWPVLCARGEGKKEAVVCSNPWLLAQPLSPSFVSLFPPARLQLSSVPPRPCIFRETIPQYRGILAMASHAGTVQRILTPRLAPPTQTRCGTTVAPKKSGQAGKSGFSCF